MALDHNDIVNFNIRAHDEIASKYDEEHVEIFSPIEQQRIQRVVREICLRLKKASSEKKTVLDFGAGTGNLTHHLLGLGVSVIAADVSPGCLDVVKKKYDGQADFATTLVLNGHDLKEMEDNSIDMIATYSVLHHVPDYLKIVREFVRVVKPGGIIYIDHEVDETYWKYNASYMAYLKELGDKFYNAHADEIGMARRVGMKSRVRAWLNKLRGISAVAQPTGLSGFGDIHVFRHDHIEWEKIKEILCAQCTIEDQSTYLVCREMDASASVWTRWNSRCSDMRLIVARKNSGNV